MVTVKLHNAPQDCYIIHQCSYNENKKSTLSDFLFLAVKEIQKISDYSNFTHVQLHLVIAINIQYFHIEVKSSKGTSPFFSAP